MVSKEQWKAKQVDRHEIKHFGNRTVFVKMSLVFITSGIFDLEYFKTSVDHTDYSL